MGQFIDIFFTFLYFTLKIMSPILASIGKGVVSIIPLRFYSIQDSNACMPIDMLSFIHFIASNVFGAESNAVLTPNDINREHIFAGCTSILFESRYWVM